MRLTDLTLKDLFTEDSKLTFLVGAGCSVDPPSCLPAGRAMIDAIIKYTCAESEINEILEIEALRFERLVEIIRDLLDKDLKIIDYYGECDKPNLQHFFLAEMIKRGHFVITTNFDFLIEYALLQLGVPKEEIKIVITKKDFEKYSNPNELFEQGLKSLFKIHGSTRNIIKNKSTKDSLIATIQAFGSNKEELNVFQIEPFKRELFNNISRDRSLVIMGYSGSDDFDVVPTLKVLKDLKDIIWINHVENDENKEKIYDIKAIPGQSLKKLKKVNQILVDIQKMDNATHVYRVDVNTTKIVKNLINFRPKISANNFTLTPKDWLIKCIENSNEKMRYQIPRIIYFDFGRYYDALRCSEELIRIAEKTSDDSLKVIALNNIGLIHRKQGNYSEALEKYKEAIEISEKLGELSSKSTTLNNIASLFSFQGNFDEAAKMYEEALLIDEQTENMRGKMNSLINLGKIYLWLGKFQEALEALQGSLKIAEQLGDLQAKASSFEGFGFLLTLQGYYSEAMKHFEQAFRITEQLGNSSAKAFNLRNIGDIHASRENLIEALRWYEEAIKIFKQLGDLLERARNLNCIGEMHRRSGNHALAMEKYKKSLSLYEKLGELKESTIVLNNIGLACYEQGKLQEALEYYENALKIGEEFKHFSFISTVLSNVGMVYYKQKKYDEALEKLTRALKIDQEYDNLPMIAARFYNIGVIYNEQEKLAEAIKYIEDALNLYTKLEKASCFNVLAAIHYKQGNYSRSLNLLQEAIDALSEIGLNDGLTAESIRKNMQVLRKKIT